MDRMRGPAGDETPTRSRLRAGALLAVLAMALGLALSAPQPAQAQTLTDEKLLSNYGGSGAASNGFAKQFTTGSATVTLAHVNVRVGHGSGDVKVAIWSDNAGEPGSESHALTAPSSLSNGKNTFTAPSGTTLTASTTYWLVINRFAGNRRPVGTSPESFATLHGWSDGDKRYWNTGTNSWDSASVERSIEIWGAVHSGPAHQPQAPDDSDYEDLRPCTEEERNRRQRPGEWPPQECRGGFLHAWEIHRHLISDPCDQPWQGPGSYRPERGCLERPAGSYSYSGPTGPREVGSPPPEPVYEWFPIEDANGNCCISERRRVR